MTAITRFEVTVYGPDGWCEPAEADALADVLAEALTAAAQRTADVAPTAHPDRLPVRVVVTEDLGPGPLMRNLRAFTATPAREPVAPVPA